MPKIQHYSKDGRFIQKTKTLVISKQSTRGNMEIDETNRKNNIKINLDIRLSFFSDIEPEKLNIETNRAIGCLNKTIWRNKRIRVKTKTRI